MPRGIFCFSDAAPLIHAVPTDRKLTALRAFRLRYSPIRPLARRA